MAKSDIHSDLGLPTSDFRLRAPNSEPDFAHDRLKRAVRAAGGARAVAERSGVPFGTLNNYLAGGGMKLSNAFALAKACGVSIEWLATGQETHGTPARPSAAAEPQKVPETAEIERARRLFSIVNVDKLAGAMEAVTDQFRRNKINPPMSDLIRAAILLYDLMTEAGSTPDENPHQDDKNHD